MSRTCPVCPAIARSRHRHHESFGRARPDRGRVGRNGSRTRTSTLRPRRRAVRTVCRHSDLHDAGGTGRPRRIPLDDRRGSAGCDPPGWRRSDYHRSLHCGEQAERRRHDRSLGADRHGRRRHCRDGLDSPGEWNHCGRSAAPGREEPVACPRNADRRRRPAKRSSVRHHGPRDPAVASGGTLWPVRRRPSTRALGLRALLLRPELRWTRHAPDSRVWTRISRQRPHRRARVVHERDADIRALEPQSATDAARARVRGRRREHGALSTCARRSCRAQRRTGAPGTSDIWPLLHWYWQW